MQQRHWQQQQQQLAVSEAALHRCRIALPTWLDRRGRKPQHTRDLHIAGIQRLGREERHPAQRGARSLVLVAEVHLRQRRASAVAVAQLVVFYTGPSSVCAVGRW